MKKMDVLRSNLKIDLTGINFKNTRWNRFIYLGTILYNKPSKLHLTSISRVYTFVLGKH